MTVLSNIITPSNVLTTTNTATVTNKTLTSPTVAGMTVSDGTANGVTYLNGSKVLTSGSALVFDGTNLGLGVTPSAWNTSNKAFQFSSSGVLFGETGNTYLGSNIFVNSSGDNRYITTNFASMYRQVDGKHLWYTAASGTAGNSITFTEALTLQNVSQANLTLRGTNASMIINSTNGVYPAVFLATSGTSFAQFAGDGTNLDIGANGYLRFMTNGYGTERARIDTSGNLLVGTTSQISGTSSRVNILNVNEGLSGLTIGNAGGSGNTNCVLFNNSNGTVGTIRTNASATAYNTSSDVRLKKNVVDAPSAIASVNQISIKSFDWNIDNSHQDFGVIAQELDAIAPEAVSHGSTEDEMWGVDYSKLVPRMIKAIQEQQALIQSLKARLDAANL